MVTLMIRRFGLLSVVGAVLWLAGCGSSSNPTTVTGIVASCLPQAIQSSQLIQCSATVFGTGAFSTMVNWTVTAGTITTAGVYTAPVVSAPLSVTVTATSQETASQKGTAGVTIYPVNLQPLTVDAGPQPQTFTARNEAFTSVTVCVPGSNTCQTIDHVLVDTGSSGLRLLSSVLTIPLPTQNDSSGNPLYECPLILSGYAWGPVAAADILLAGEKASSAAVQVMIPAPPNGSPPVPGTCSSRTPGPNLGNSVTALGANGVLGVGLFQKDCGNMCTTSNGSIPPVYYDCPASGCNPTYVTLAQQVPNPVTMLSYDNNGVMLFLPSVPAGGLTTVNGSLIFGVGTQANNALQSATVYTVPDSGANAGQITTTFNGVNYPGTIDSGSPGIFFLDNGTTGIPTCIVQGLPWYCPTSPDSLSATNQGANGNQGVVNFSIENANTLLNSGNSAFSTLGGPQTGSFDFGLSFFFGRNVFTAIENMSTPAGPGPYFAY